jgi:hypothetical protein
MVVTADVDIENCAPLGLYASSSGNFLEMFRYSLSFPFLGVILTPEDWTDGFF